MEDIRYSYHPSAVGRLLIAGAGDILRFISFTSGGSQLKPGKAWRKDNSSFPDAKRQLDAYFAGELTEFDLDLAYDGDAFQAAVWQAMRDIPYGKTISYGEIARQIGEPPSSSRAVGIACGANPLPIVIPCHRVIGADGSLVGFGGGLPTKRFLLDLERRVRPLPGQQLELFTQG